MESARDLVDEMLRATASGDTVRQQTLFAQLDEKFLEDGVIEGRLFDAICDGLGEPAVLGSKNSAAVVKLFQYCDDLVDEGQRVRLIERLETSFERFKDPASCILVAEIIADLQPAEQAFACLSRMLGVPQELPRSIAVYGLRHFVEKEHDKSLVGRAVTQLSRMKSDRSKLVRDEVERALKMLGTP